MVAFFVVVLLAESVPSVGRPLFLGVWFAVVSAVGIFARRLIRAMNAYNQELGVHPRWQAREEILVPAFRAAAVLMILVVALTLWFGAA